MTADFRYPNMHPIDGRDLPCLFHAEHKAAIERFASSVARRSCTYAWWNEIRQAIHFCLRPSCEVAIMQVNVYEPGGIFRLPDEDLTCRQIYRGRMPARRKDALREQAEKDARDAAESQYQREMDHSRVERSKDARRILRITESGGLSRPMVTV